ncbi:MAG: T9SS type A sorting domain-containing protein [Bacteroidales bacterium]|jgi:thiol-disulfide isomerase/thioredoxin|nr:T9SS type A sorting domain-containing protein [Bacteroidales bacterium]
MKKLTLLLILLLTIKFASGQTQLDTALNFSVKDIYGNTIELFEILDEGKIVVIDFFSTTCGFCILYTPDFQASHEDFGENDGNVYFMKIAWGDDNAGVAYFDSTYNLTTPSVSGSEGGGNQVYNDYMIQATPTVIVIAPDREILEQQVWEPTRENINAAVIAAGGTLVGIDDGPAENRNSLTIYPNPSRGLISISFELENTAGSALEVYNLMGKKVFDVMEKSFPAGKQRIDVDLSGLTEGTYLIRHLINGKPAQSKRLILLD